MTRALPGTDKHLLYISKDNLWCTFWQEFCYKKQKYKTKSVRVILNAPLTEENRTCVGGCLNHLSIDIDKSRAQIAPDAYLALSLLDLHHEETTLDDNIYFSEISIHNFTIWLNNRTSCYLLPKEFLNIYWHRLAILFIDVKIWKQSRCPLLNKWI